MSFESSSHAKSRIESEAFIASEVRFDELVLPSVLPASFDALKAILIEQRLADNAAASVAIQSAIETAVKSALAAADQRHNEQLLHILEEIRLERHRRFGSSSEQLSDRKSVV